MLATYASVFTICVASLAIGQAALALCGWWRWSGLAPGVGLALVAALCWATVRLPGDGSISALAMALVGVASLAFLRGRVEGTWEALRAGIPVALGALLAASLPFIVEGRFGILGTGFNPDMSQHLLATDRLVHGSESQLLGEGYPLGPHSIVVALDKGLGVGLVQGFGGLTLAIAVLASLTALAALAELPPIRRWFAALLVGLPYMVASYLAQGAFKETMQALFVLAFALGLWALSASGTGGRRRGPDEGRGSLPPNAQLAAVPLAIIAAGSVFTYSFPGLTWLLGALGIWAVAELFLVQRGGGQVGDALRTALRPAWLALVVFAVLLAPELGRIAEFASFETFDPDGPGLGNLFNPISPLEAFGIWPSGDFRLDPGDGAAPAAAYWLGGLAAAGATVYGLAWWCRWGELAVPAALVAAGLLYGYAHLAGTPYQEAKAIMLAAPLATLVSVRALLAPAASEAGRRGPWEPLRPAVGAGLVAVAGACSLVALANAPVGPRSYSPVLAGLGPLPGSTLVLAPQGFLADEHGRDYLVWELRGGRVCVRPAGPGSSKPPPEGISQVITMTPRRSGPPFTLLGLRRRDGEYALWWPRRRPVAPGPCPFVSTGQRADPG